MVYDTYIILYYYPGTQKTFFISHVAMWDGKYFMSFPEELTHCTVADTKALHHSKRFGKYRKIILPVPREFTQEREKLVTEIAKNFFDKKYSFARRNCADAVSEYLALIGYENMVGCCLHPRIPTDVANQACKAAKKMASFYIDEEEQKLRFADECLLMQKILDDLAVKIEEKAVKSQLCTFRKPSGVLALKKLLQLETDMVKKFFIIFRKLVDLHYKSKPITRSHYMDDFYTYWLQEMYDSLRQRESYTPTIGLRC